MTDAAIIPFPSPTAPVVYDPPEEQIAATVARTALLVSADTSQNYESVRLAIAEYRTTMVAVENQRKEMKAPVLDLERRIDERAKQLQALMEPERARLQALKDAADAEKARAKAEKAEAERREFEARVREEQRILYETQRLLDGVAGAARAHERQAEEAKLAEERERQRAEQERLDAERAALEDSRAEQERQERAAREAALAARAAEDARIAEDRRKLAEEQAAVEREKARLAAGEAARRAKAEAEREALARAEVERQAAEERAIAEAERQAALARRLDALRPDREKLAAYATALLAVPRPEVADPIALRALNTARGLVNEAADTLRNVTDEEVSDDD